MVSTRSRGLEVCADRVHKCRTQLLDLQPTYMLNNAYLHTPIRLAYLPVSPAR